MQQNTNMRAATRATACQCQLAMATVPMQRFEQFYPLAKALRHGTVFAALDLPFHPREEGIR